MRTHKVHRLVVVSTAADGSRVMGCHYQGCTHTETRPPAVPRSSIATFKRTPKLRGL